MTSAPIRKPVPPWLLPLIIALGVALAVLFAVMTPAGGMNPDEPSHLSYLRLILEQHGFVRFTAGDPAYFETHQPPLYYLLCLPVYALTSGNLLALRLVAVLLQGITIWVTWRAARDLFPSRPEVAPAAAAFVAFLPTQAQLAGAVNNDSLTTLLCTALVWKLARMVRKGTSTMQSCLWIGGLFGLGLLTKLSVLQMIPAVAVAYFLVSRMAKSQPTGKTLSPIVGFVGALALGFVIASPWLVRNTLLYGDPFTLKIFPLTAGEGTPTPQLLMPGFGWTWFDYWRIDSLRTYETFWHILPPFRLAPVLPTLALTLLIGVGGFVGAFRTADRGGLEHREERRVVGFLTGALGLLVPFFVRFNFQFFQAQGRYFLPALLAAALLCVIGWGTVAGEKQRGFALGFLTLLLLGLSVYQLTHFPAPH